MKYDELKELILFPMGLPSVYHIRLGMSNYETEDYQEQLDMKETKEVFVLRGTSNMKTELYGRLTYLWGLAPLWASILCR